jgi:hypothetical protein
MTTAIIPRPPEKPPIRVLECDGPRHKHFNLGEGYYYLATDNQPRIVGLDCIHIGRDPDPDPALNQSWDEPHWEIYQLHEGTIEVHACRPSFREIMDGDLHGRIGSVIRLRVNNKPTMRNALHVARTLLHCDPRKPVLFPEWVTLALDIEAPVPIITYNFQPV